MIRRPLFLALCLLIFVAIVGFLLYRPATVTGVHATELAKSVGAAANGGSPEGCRDLGDSDWACHSTASGKGGRALTYRVHVHGQFGCWKARRTGTAGPTGLSGCLTIGDYF